jgi:hypothetical protein
LRAFRPFRHLLRHQQPGQRIGPEEHQAVGDFRRNPEFRKAQLSAFGTSKQRAISAGCIDSGRDEALAADFREQLPEFGGFGDITPGGEGEQRLGFDRGGEIGQGRHILGLQRVDSGGID